jgi:hypothetical protein
MLTPSLPHMQFFHFDDTCYLGSHNSTNFPESTLVFDSFLEGRFSNGSRMLCLKEYSRIDIQMTIIDLEFHLFVLLDSPILSPIFY